MEHCDFLNTDISQGNVTTYLRCDRIFKYVFVANLSPSLSAEKFENRLIFGEVMDKSCVLNFLAHGVESAR